MKAGIGNYLTVFICERSCGRFPSKEVMSTGMGIFHLEWQKKIEAVLAAVIKEALGLGERRSLFCRVPLPA